MAAVVFNAFAVPDFAEHFQVKTGALLQPLCLNQFAHAHQLLQALRQLQLNGFDRRQNLLARRHVMAAGVHGKTRNFLADAARERVKQLQAFNFVVKQLNAQRHFAVLGRKHINGVAAHPEIAPGKIQVVALVLHAHQLGNHIALAHAVAAAQRHDHLVVALGVANAVNRRHRGHNDHIAPLHEAFGATQAHLLNVLVDGAVFFNKQVALRHISLRLVVVVITYKVLHRVFRKKFPKFAVELSGQRFVGCKHNGGAAQAGNHVGHGEGLPRASHTQ